MDQRAPIELAVERMGSVKALAEAVGCTPQAIAQWKRVPSGRAIAINEATGIPLHELRDDLWKAPTTEQAGA